MLCAAGSGFADIFCDRAKVIIALLEEKQVNCIVPL